MSRFALGFFAIHGNGSCDWVFFFWKKIFSAPTICNVRIGMPTTFWLIFLLFLYPHQHMGTQLQLLVLWQRSFCSQLGRSASYSLQMLVANICTQLSLSMNSSSKLGAICHLSKDGVVKLQSNAYTKQESNSTLPRWMQNAPNLAASIRPSYRLQQIFTEFRLESISID